VTDTVYHFNIYILQWTRECALLLNTGQDRKCNNLQ